jgi:hypothetical protein
MYSRLALCALISTLALPLAQASTSFSCGGDCNGNLYAVSMLSHSGNTYTLEYDIQVTNSYTGGPSDFINAVSLKDFVSDFTSPLLIEAPGGVSNWNVSSHGITANGCGEGNTKSLCAQSTGTGTALFSGSTPAGILSWVFQFDSSSDLNPSAHIKYLYVNSEGSKVGSLGSWDLTIQCTNGDCGGIPPQELVPEPLSMGLAGAGLVGIYFLRRRKHV